MKTIIVALGILTGIASSHDAVSNENEETPNSSVLFTYEQEIELLKEYLPVYDTSFLYQLIIVQVYDSNYNLIMEGNTIEGEDIEDTELINLLYDSDFIIKIGDKSIYMLSK